MDTIVKNDVVLVGTIVSNYRPNPEKQIATIILATNGSSLVTNYPRITFYGQEAVAQLEQLVNEKQKHPHVLIRAVVETSRKFRTVAGTQDREPVYYQTIVARSVTKAPTKLNSLNCNGRTPIDDVNRVSLIGEVVYTSKMQGGSGHILTLRSLEDGKTFFPEVACFARSCPKAKDVKVGDVVAGVGLIQTRTKEQIEANPKPRVQSVVFSDVEIVTPIEG